jgi:hypothetical protein
MLSVPSLHIQRVVTGRKDGEEMQLSISLMHQRGELTEDDSTGTKVRHRGNAARHSCRYYHLPTSTLPEVWPLIRKK